MIIFCRLTAPHEQQLTLAYGSVISQTTSLRGSGAFFKDIVAQMDRHPGIFRLFFEVFSFSKK